MCCHSLEKKNDSDALAHPSALAFVHIPKCSGTAFENYVGSFRQFAGKFDCFTGINPHSKQHETFQEFAARNMANTFIFGHVPIFLYERHFPNALLATFLRDPVQRTISNYKSWNNPKNWSKDDPHHIGAPPELHEAIRFSHNASLLEFICTQNPTIRASALGNQQIYFLSSYDRADASLEEHLESAKRNLDRIVFVGLTERFDESLQHFRSIFPDAPPYSLDLNKENRSPQEDVEITQEITDIISTSTTYDARLYEHAVMLFNGRIEERKHGLGRTYLLSDIGVSRDIHHSVSARVPRESLSNNDRVATNPNELLGGAENLREIGEELRQLAAEKELVDQQLIRHRAVQEELELKIRLLNEMVASMQEELELKIRLLNEMVASMQIVEKDIKDKNQYLQRHLEELTALYLNIIHSKSWRFIEIIRRLKNRIFQN